MAKQSTNTIPVPARPRPDWVWDRTDARIRAEEYLLQPERDLLAAASLLIRARHGRTHLDDAKGVARDLVRYALEGLESEAARS